MTEKDIIIELRTSIMKMAIDVYRSQVSYPGEQLPVKKSVLTIYKELYKEITDGLSI